AKSDSICRTTDVVNTGTMAASPPDGNLGSHSSLARYWPDGAHLVGRLSSEIAGMMQHPTDSGDPLFFGMLDQDVAEVKSFTRRGGEVFTDPPAGSDVPSRPVDDPVGRAGDQRGKRDAALGVGGRRGVMGRVDTRKIILVGRQACLVGLVGSRTVG